MELRDLGYLTDIWKALASILAWREKGRKEEEREKGREDENLESRASWVLKAMILFPSYAHLLPLINSCLFSPFHMVLSSF